MSEKIPAPADIRYDAYCEAGKEFPGHSDAYFKVQAVIPRWGVVRSMQVTILRNVETVQAQDIWMQDFGVVLRNDSGTDEIWLSMQLYDTCGTTPRIKNNYHVVANIQFLSQTVEVDVPLQRNPEKASKASRSPSAM